MHNGEPVLWPIKICMHNGEQGRPIKICMHNGEPVVWPIKIGVCYGEPVVWPMNDSEVQTL